MADFDFIPIHTTAEKLERISNMEINTTDLGENSDDGSLPTSKLVYEAIKDFGNITVDQEYSPTSENPQSGKAVEEAINESLGVISNALDELHAYAQGYVTGGTSE